MDTMAGLLLHQAATFINEYTSDFCTCYRLDKAYHLPTTALAANYTKPLNLSIVICLHLWLP